MNRELSEDDSDLHAGGSRLNLTRKSAIEADEISGTSAMLRRRKQPKITLFSSPNSKMNWTKNDELIILRGILDYENAAELSYKADSDAFLLYIKDFMNVKFSKEQLMRKIRKLKTRFENNIEKFNNEKDLKFATSDDYEVFKLSNLLWGQNEDQFDAPLHINQPNDGALVVEHTPVAYTVIEKEKEKENGGKENGTSVVERALVTCTIMEKEKENGGKENGASVEHTQMSCTDKEKEKKEKEFGALVEHTLVSCTDMEKEKEKEKEEKEKEKEEKEKEKEEKEKEKEEKEKEKEKKKKKRKKKEKMKEKENGALVEHLLVSYTTDTEKEQEKEIEMEKENGAALVSYTEHEKEKENGAALVSYTEQEKEKEKEKEKKKGKEMGKQQEQQQEKEKEKEKEKEQKQEKEKEQKQEQEKEKNGGKEDSEEEWCDLEDALDSTLFQNLSRYHQKLMLQSLRNIGADKRKELRNEWKALVVEEVKLNIKKQAFSAKLVNAHLSN